MSSPLEWWLLYIYTQTQTRMSEIFFTGQLSWESVKDYSNINYQQCPDSVIKGSIFHMKIIHSSGYQPLFIVFLIYKNYLIQIICYLLFTKPGWWNKASSDSFISWHWGHQTMNSEWRWGLKLSQLCIWYLNLVRPGQARQAGRQGPKSSRTKLVTSTYPHTPIII